jgi:hypothetical protein
MPALRIVLLLVGIIFCPMLPGIAQDKNASPDTPSALGAQNPPTVEPLQLMAQFGAAIDKQSRALIAKDDEIKKQQAILAQLQKQRNDLAEYLTGVSRILPSVMIYAKESMSSPRPDLLTKPNPAPADVQEDRLAEVMAKLESIENRLATVEKRESVQRPEALSAPKEEPAPMRPAECPLASKDKEKTVRVVILSQSPLEPRPEFLRVHSDLPLILSQEMQAGFEKNKEKVTMVANNLVEKYKDEHPNWKAMQAVEIGRNFKADYVIELQVNQISLYEPGSYNTLFRGRCDISMVVHDVLKSSEGPKYQEEYSTEFPKARGPIDASNGGAAQFRYKFLDVICRELSWRFTSHNLEDDYKCQ